MIFIVKSLWSYNEKLQTTIEMNEQIATLAAEIAELSGEISVYEGLTTNPILRRENRIKTIYSSLAIEQNTLSIGQVTDIIDGKRVLAPPSDIKEVQNAYEIYEKLDRLNPYSIEDLLVAHRIMTKDLITESGMFRSGNAGVYDGEKVDSCWNSVKLHTRSDGKFVYMA